MELTPDNIKTEVINNWPVYKNRIEKIRFKIGLGVAQYPEKDKFYKALFYGGAVSIAYGIFKAKGPIKKSIFIGTPIALYYKYRV